MTSSDSASERDVRRECQLVYSALASISVMKRKIMTV
uniref:Uncharacterized protein n=1 Tax=Anguilla anguilla TaxID=7936 RepID=A0A0E9UI06_ANGAN